MAQSRRTHFPSSTGAAPGVEHPAQPSPESTTPSGDGKRRTITLGVPSLDRVATGALNAALVPVALARQILPAKRGLPLYLGLGALGAADVIEWPVAIGVGLGYAVLRHGEGVLAGPPRPPEPTTS